MTQFSRHASRIASNVCVERSSRRSTSRISIPIAALRGRVRTGGDEARDADARGCGVSKGSSRFYSGPKKPQPAAAVKPRCSRAGQEDKRKSRDAAASRLEVRRCANSVRGEAVEQAAAARAASKGRRSRAKDAPRSTTARARRSGVPMRSRWPTMAEPSPLFFVQLPQVMSLPGGKRASVHKRAGQDVVEVDDHRARWESCVPCSETPVSMVIELRLAIVQRIDVWTAICNSNGVHPRTLADAVARVDRGLAVHRLLAEIGAPGLAAGADLRGESPGNACRRLRCPPKIGAVRAQARQRNEERHVGELERRLLRRMQGAPQTRSQARLQAAEIQKLSSVSSSTGRRTPVARS